MPGGTGLQLAEYLRSIDNKCPIILFTGYSEDVLPQELIKYNIFKSLKKPINNIEILTEIKSAISLK